jgi:pimeloyl-ACP methyl ester carboxylesterase
MTTNSQNAASEPANAHSPAAATRTGADTGAYPDSVIAGVRDDLHLRVLTWRGTRRPFVLLHGLASNAHTWTAVARELQAAGHPVYAVDQRGHGHSDKPDDGYDFATVTEDLARLCDVLQLDRPIVAGQSWGGNVVLDFGARYGDRVAGLVLVDGGFLDLQSRPDVTWERIADQLRPPPLAGTPRQELKDRMAHWHPDWTEEGIEGTLHNFETLPDGTIRPWLTLDRHMRILRALWDQRPQEIYPQVRVPLLLAAAEDSSNPEWMAVKHRQVAAAAALLRQAEVHWFADTAHDIHVHRPAALAGLMLDWSRQL